MRHEDLARLTDQRFQIEILRWSLLGIRLKVFEKSRFFVQAQSVTPADGERPPVLHLLSDLPDQANLMLLSILRFNYAEILNVAENCVVIPFWGWRICAPS